MKVLITGCSGFLGKNLIYGLKDEDCDIKCLDVVKPFISSIKRASFIQGSIESRDIVDEAVRGVDSIIHLACNVTPKISNKNPLSDVITNIQGAINLLDAAVKHNVKRFVFISSGGTVYGDAQTVPITEDHPTNPNCSYGITKLSIEKYLRLYCRENGLSTCSLRLSNPYGEFQRVQSAQGVIPVFCYKIIKGEQVDVWGDGNVVRDFIYVNDVIDAIKSALCKREVIGEFNIASGKGTSIKELITLIENVVGRKSICTFSQKQSFDVPINILDIKRAQSLLQWSPKVSLEDGLRRTVKWIKENNIL